MAELEDKVQREFRERGEILSGNIAIGSAETNAAAILPDAIAKFRNKYPGVTFDMQTDTAEHVKERIDRGLLEIGLLVEPGDIEKYEFMRLGIGDRCGVLMNADSPLAQKEYVTADDLAGLPVVANRRAEVQSFYRNALGEAYNKLNVVATFNLINNAALFALKNLGYVITLEGTVRHYENPRLCFRPFRPEIQQSTFIIWKKYQPTTRAVRKFIEEISMLLPHDEV